MTDKSINGEWVRASDEPLTIGGECRLQIPGKPILMITENWELVISEGVTPKEVAQAIMNGWKNVKDEQEAIRRERDELKAANAELVEVLKKVSYTLECMWAYLPHGIDLKEYRAHWRGPIRNLRKQYQRVLRSEATK